jgi:hypothetical protein
VSTFLEVLTVAALVPLVGTLGRADPAPAGRRDRPAAAAAAVVVVILLTALATSSSEPVARTGHHALGAPRTAGHALGTRADG